MGTPKMVFGLIGNPLDHSFSARYFSEKFKKEGIDYADYRLFPLKNISLLPELLANNPLLCGFNVTIPFKEQILPWLDEVDNSVKESGAVNTVLIRKVGDKNMLSGFNTDIFGFLELVKDFPLLSSDKALILGTGGASKAVSAAFRRLGITYTFVSRNTSSQDSLLYTELQKEHIQQHRIIVNTTPLGMFPEISTCPEIPYHAIGNEHVIFDLVYNPERTVFIDKCSQQGAIAVNGLKMLYGQAEKSWEIWSGAATT
jgi:shikimate dehydrogenase